jgi:hypothetical protein
MTKKIVLLKKIAVSRAADRDLSVEIVYTRRPRQRQNNRNAASTVSYRGQPGFDVGPRWKSHRRAGGSAFSIIQTWKPWTKIIHSSAISANPSSSCALTVTEVLTRRF